MAHIWVPQELTPWGPHPVGGWPRQCRWTKMQLPCFNSESPAGESQLSSFHDCLLQDCIIFSLLFWSVLFLLISLQVLFLVAQYTSCRQISISKSVIQEPSLRQLVPEGTGEETSGVLVTVRALGLWEEIHLDVWLLLISLV